MTQVEEQLLQSLLELEQAVRPPRPGEPKPDLQALFQRIDSVAAQLPAQTDPQLVHFLQRKSYEKARLVLEGKQAARGRCGS